MNVEYYESIKKAPPKDGTPIIGLFSLDEGPLIAFSVIWSQGWLVYNQNLFTYFDWLWTGEADPVFWTKLENFKRKDIKNEIVE